MGHMKRLNGSLGGVSPLCIIDTCDTDTCTTESCWLYDKCGFDYAPPCKLWDSCFYDY